MPGDPAPAPSGTRAHLALFALACLAAWWIGPAGPVYWDSYGYVADSITGRVGSLMLGRPGFALASHVMARAWLSLGASIWSLEPALRLAWMLVTATSAPSVAALAARLGFGARPSLIAGALVALSPALAHTASAVLTDGPSLAFTALAFVLAAPVAASASLRTMAVAALTLGLAVALREQAIAHVVTLVALACCAPRRRASLVAVALVGATLPVAALAAWCALRQPGYVASVLAWSHEMTRERAQHPYGLRDLGAYLGWLVASGPVALIAALAALTPAWRRALTWTPTALAVCLPSALMLAALAAYQDIAFSPRYLVGVLPFALALPAARVLDRWVTSRALGRAVAASVVAFAACAGVAMRRVEGPLREAIDTLPARLAAVPRDAAVVTGQLCPAVVFLRRLSAYDERFAAARPAWVQVCPGWRWPDDLAARLDGLRAEGHAVVLDLRASAWQGPRQRARLAEAQRYARAHRGEAGVTVWQ